MSDKASLLAEIERSRLAIRREVAAVADEINPLKKFESVVRRKPAAWLAGAATCGFLLAALRRDRTPKPARREEDRAAAHRAGHKNKAPAAHKLTLWGFLLALVKLAFPIAKPLLSAYASKRMAELAIRLGAHS